MDSGSRSKSVSNSHSKRNLYHPASDSSKSVKKTRRPLIQGRLVSDVDSEINGSSDFSASLLPQSEFRNDVDQDPTLSPMRRVPQRTEKASPRPEPPSSCLDLSDVDLDLTATSSSSKYRGQGRPVMVYDASQAAADSPHSCEIELSVGVEASPARVVCHTPSHLDKARNSPRTAMSPLAVTVNMMPAQTGTNSKGVGIKRDGLSRTLFPDGDDDENEEDEDDEIQFKKVASEASLHISQQSRGIIEEILAHEMGKSAIEVISLNSQSNSPQAQQASTNDFSSFSRGSLALHSIQEGKIAGGAKSSSSGPKPKSFVDNDSDDACSVNEYVKPKVSPADQENSVARQTKSSVPSDEQSGSQTPKQSKQKKKAPRQVASRYMQSSLNRKTNLTNNSSGNTLPTASIKTQNANAKHLAPAGRPAQDRRTTVQHKHDTKPSSSATGKSVTGKAGALKTGLMAKNRHFNNRSSANLLNETPQHLTVRGEAVGGGTDRKTSTPTSDDTIFPTSYIDASAIQSASIMHINASAAQFDATLKEDCSINLEGKDRDAGKKMKRHASSYRGAGDGGEHQTVSQLDLDMAYTRYLQWQFLQGRARQAFHHQQQQASAQLTALWRITEARRQEAAQLEADVARLRSMVLLDKVLDEAEPELSSSVAGLPTVAADYSHMTAALDGTCHQLPVADVYLPPGGDTGREAMEERLSAALSQAEHLLGAINESSGGKHTQQLLSQYLTCLAAVEKTSEATGQELQQCRRDLEKVHSLNTRLASLTVQDMQFDS